MAAGPEIAKVFKAADDARKMAAKSNVQNWNEATAMVINGQAGGQIMGDWAQGEFQVAGQVAGKDYTCLPGLGLNAVIATGGDAFYFPRVDDPEVSAAQEKLAHVMMSPETQVAFNLKKGSLPVRGDVDLAAANDCMKKGLEILAAGKTMQWTDELISPGHDPADERPDGRVLQHPDASRPRTPRSASPRSSPAPTETPCRRRRPREAGAGDVQRIRPRGIQ